MSQLTSPLSTRPIAPVFVPNPSPAHSTVSITIFPPSHNQKENLPVHRSPSNSSPAPLSLQKSSETTGNYLQKEDQKDQHKDQHKDHAVMSPIWEAMSCIDDDDDDDDQDDDYDQHASYNNRALHLDRVTSHYANDVGLVSWDHMDVLMRRFEYGARPS